jgi:hypothetical protein
MYVTPTNEGLVVVELRATRRGLKSSHDRIVDVIKELSIVRSRVAIAEMTIEDEEVVADLDRFRLRLERTHERLQESHDDVMSSNLPAVLLEYDATD